MQSGPGGEEPSAQAKTEPCLPRGECAVLSDRGVRCEQTDHGPTVDTTVSQSGLSKVVPKHKVFEYTLIWPYGTLIHEAH